MKRRTCLLVLSTALTSLVPGAIAAAEDTQIFELRVYYAAEGKLDDLHARFRDHTRKLFAKHGITNIGYWVPVENPQRKLVYVLAYPSREAREASWKGFLADPDWKAAQATSEKNGRLVAKIESTHLVATDFSPAIKPAAAEKERVFELRTYTASEGNLPRLLERFRNHTVRLFARHGMQNLAYWTPAAGQPDAARTLVYLLAHPSREAQEAAFKSFRSDPDWIAAKAASEKEAGGPLTTDGGVKSELLAPTDYSPMR